MANIVLPSDASNTGKPVRALLLTGGDYLQQFNITDATGTNPLAVDASGRITTVTSHTSPNGAARSIYQYMNPYGTARVSLEPTVLFFDPFDGAVIDTTNRWTTAGTQVPTQVAGAALIQATVGASVANNSQLISQPTFVSPGLGLTVFGNTVTLEAASTATNVHRFWGKGQVTSYAYTTPVTDGIGFEVDGAGALQCVIYVGGTKYVINSTVAANISSSVAGMGGTGTALPAGASASAYGAPLTWQGNQHRYAVLIRSDIAFWYIEGQETPVATAAYLAPNVQAVPIRYAAITNNAATSTAYTFQVGATAVSDSTAQNHTLSDPTYQWRRATMSPQTTKTGLDVNLVGSSGGTAASSGAVSATALATVTGTINTTSVVVANVSNAGNATIILFGGTYTALQLFFEVSNDGINWQTTDATRQDGTGVDGVDGTQTYTAAGTRMWNVPLPGVTYVRARVATITQTVAPTITINQGPFLWEPSPITRDFLAGSGKRTIFTAFVSVAPSTTDTLVTLTPYRNGVAGTAATSLGVTAGRTLRIQSIALNMRSTTAAIASGSIFLRYNPTGATVIGSPVAEALGAATAAAVIGQSAGVNLSLADGMELSGAGTFGVSLYGIAAGTANIVIKGYEFA